MDLQALIASQPALALVPKELMARAEHREAEPGQTLFRIGDRVRNLFYVLSGEVRLIRRDREGAELVLQRSREGFLAEASLNSKAYHCDGVSVAQGALLCFPVQAFRSALEDVRFRDAWIGHLSREVRKLRSQCERLGLRNAADRIMHYIEFEGSGGTVVLNQSRKAWAAELGLTHEALYRTLRRLEDGGVLRVVDAQTIALLPPARKSRSV